ncbi:MAG: ATP-dependent helicase HrpB [Bradymonadaceae bacterium]
MYDSGFPIDEVLPDLVESLDEQQGVVLVAPTGAGKTTQVPQAILDAGLVPEDQRILVLEPRRVAARATARRIADERNVGLGGEVGYQVRFDRRIGDQTRIAIITEGILTRRLQDDPLLEGVGVVVLDEFHERSIHSDLSIAFLKELMEVREDLMTCVMSATITAGPIAEYLGVPTVESEGRTHPVDITYRDKSSDDDIEKQAARAVRRALDDPDDDGGDILVFMPGAGAIHRTIEVLESMSVTDDIEIVPLYGALPPEEQDEAIEPSDHRKIIVSTNIAETSLTIEGVTTVVDSGLHKQLKMSPDSGLDRLEQTHVSLASADQRSGRAGRTRPGRAYRLWTHAFEHRMPEEETAEILRVDITGPVLEVIAWSGDDPRDFDWFEAPPEHALDRAVELLRQLGAVSEDGYRITEDGEKMLGLPAHPRISRMLIEAGRRGCLDRVAGMAALLSERDFVLSVDRDAPTGTCDLQFRVEVLEEVAGGRTRSANSVGMDVHIGRARRVAQVRNQLKGMVVEKGASGDVDAGARKSLVRGFPDRICLSRETGRHYVMVGGEPLALAYESVVREAPVVIASVIAGETRAPSTGAVGSRALIRKASAMEFEWLDELFPDRFRRQVEVEFDDERERVMAFRRERFDDLLIEESIASVDEEADPADVTGILVEEVLQDLDRSFDLDESDRQFLKRIECLREWRPDLAFPAVWPDEEGGPERLREILEQLCWGKRSFEDLRRIDLSSQFRQFLDHDQINALDGLAPTRLEVPSGATHQIHYEPGEPPTMEVRIQEMFGATQGPRVGGGEVAVLLKLLAPNFRPAQITDDLANFWKNTYPDVKKEMKGRYPKHPWPDEPWEAEPVAM